MWTYNGKEVRQRGLGLKSCPPTLKGLIYEWNDTMVSGKLYLISLIIAAICLIGTLVCSTVIEYNTISYVGELIVGIGWLFILYILSWVILTRRVKR